MKLNKWVILEKGKYCFTYYISTSLKFHAEFGIVFEKGPTYHIREPHWQLSILLGWIRLYFVKYLNKP